MSRQR